MGKSSLAEEWFSHRNAQWSFLGPSSTNYSKRPMHPVPLSSVTFNSLPGVPVVLHAGCSHSSDVAGGARKSLSLSATVCGIPEFSSIISQQVQHILQLQQDVKTSFVINLHM